MFCPPRDVAEQSVGSKVRYTFTLHLESEGMEYWFCTVMPSLDLRACSMTVVIAVR